MQNVNKAQQLIIAIVATLLVVAFLPHLGMYDYLSVFIFVLFGTIFFFALGKGVPIKALIIIIASLQWLIGAVLSYHFYPNSQFYYMEIVESKYMSYVIPGIVAFALGLYLFSGKDEKKAENGLKEIFDNPMEFYKKGYTLIIIGYIATIIMKWGHVPSSLRYFTLLISNFKMIGAFYVFASGAPLRWVWIILAFGLQVAAAFGEAMFHDMILWGEYLFILYCFINRSGFMKKALILCLMVFAVFMIQTIKQKYRDVVWNGAATTTVTHAMQNNSSDLGTAFDIAQQQAEAGTQGALSESNMQKLVDRINQGWIIARIMYVVPDYVPFADGETIRDALKAALLPRFLAPDKAKSGGHGNFARFTGLPLSSDTSMNLSTLGEAYANYGINGGIFFMFLLGFLYNVVYKIVIKKSSKIPELVFWIPFIFFYTVKAEGDFATSLNQLIKSIFVLIVMLYVLKRLFPKKSFEPKPEKS